MSVLGPIIVPIVSSRNHHYHGPPPTLTEVLVVLHWMLVLAVLMWMAIEASLDGPLKRKQALAYGLACWAWLIGGLALVLP